MRYDISLHGQEDEFPLQICFSSDNIDHMIVLTNQNRLLKYSTVSGELITAVSCYIINCLII